MENEVVSTVPHMHLFMELKRKFPELKDADITDCIQRFGLHRERCEEELSKKIQEHQRNYNSPWNLSRTTSRTSTGSRTSPHSDVPHTLSPIHNGSSSTSTHGLPSPTTPLSQQNSSSCFSDSEDEPLTKPSPIAGIGMPTYFRQTEENPYSGDRKLPTSPEHQLSSSFNCTSSHINNNLVDQTPTSGLSQPNSAPIMSPTLDPFIYSPNRRSSAETESERLKRILNSPNIGEHFADQKMYYVQNYSFPPTKTTTCTLTTASPPVSLYTSYNNASNQTCNNIPSTKHVTSLHFVPSMPHSAHHSPLPTPSDCEALCLGNRSYTSVNLQLRQPTSDPQPPIDIQSRGSSLSYSTSSLDHKKGSRSSLQVSIGPSGGSISAIRTNLKMNKPNTAFHIQYCSSDQQTPPPSSTVFPVLNDVPEGRDQFCSGSSVKLADPRVQPPKAPRPQTWYVNTSESGESIPHLRPRRTSLPDTTGPPPFQELHYPPTLPPSGVSSPMMASGYQSASEWVLEPIFIEAGIQEQLTKKEKLQEVLNRRLEEKAQLEEEVKKLSVELESKEMNQRLDVEQCKKRIEFIQHENSRLQFVCDEMEREILESGETPQTDQDGRRPSRLAISSRDVSMPAFNDSNRGNPLPILRASSTSSLHSSRAGTPATPTMPARRAPTPPIHVSVSPAGPGPEPDQLSNQSPVNRPVQSANDDSGWACSKCTFENSPYLNECEMCGFPHFPPVGTPPSSLAYQHPHAGGSCYCHHRHHQYNLSTDNQGTVHPSP